MQKPASLKVRKKRVAVPKARRRRVSVETRNRELGIAVAHMGVILESIVAHHLTGRTFPREVAENYLVWWRANMDIYGLADEDLQEGRNRKPAGRNKAAGDDYAAGG